MPHIYLKNCLYECTFFRSIRQVFRPCFQKSSASSGGCRVRFVSSVPDHCCPFTGHPAVSASPSESRIKAPFDMCRIDGFPKNPRLKKAPKCLVNKSLPISLQTTVPSGKLPILTSPMFPNYKIVRRKSRSSAKKLFVHCMWQLFSFKRLRTAFIGTYVRIARQLPLFFQPQSRLLKRASPPFRKRRSVPFVYFFFINNPTPMQAARATSP